MKTPINIMIVYLRLRETQGRRRAEDLNERVMIWSLFVTFAIVLVGIAQVR